MLRLSLLMLFFFFNDTATTEIYTLSLHDALPISAPWIRPHPLRPAWGGPQPDRRLQGPGGTKCNHLVGSYRPQVDRKSTRLNSSHSQISYAVFCLKKKRDPRPCTSARATFRRSPW